MGMITWGFQFSAVHAACLQGFLTATALPVRRVLADVLEHARNYVMLLLRRSNVEVSTVTHDFFNVGNGLARVFV